MRVVLAAEEAAGVQALRLIAAQEDVELVAVLSSAPSGSRRGVVVADVAKKHGLALVPAEQVREAAFAKWLDEHSIDMLINVHSLYIVHEDVVAAPRIGSFNLHPGPLPNYAGLNAPSWAIFNREERHAVTLHWMTDGVDTGAIVDTAWFDLDHRATGLSCSVQCTRLGVPLVGQLIKTAVLDRTAIPARPQSGGKRVLYKKGDVPFDGKIDWGRPAAQLDAFIRAADYHPMPSPWGHPETAQNGRSLQIVKVERSGRRCDVAPGSLAMSEEGTLEVATGDEWLIIKRALQDGAILAPADLLGAGKHLDSLRSHAT